MKTQNNKELIIFTAGSGFVALHKSKMPVERKLGILSIKKVIALS